MDRTDEQLIALQERLKQIDPDEMLPALEGLLFAAGTEGLTDKQIARVLQLPESDVRYVCELLRERQARESRMMQVVRIADTWQLTTHPKLSPFLRLLAMAPAPSSLSQAALETLAIIAYRQPISRLGIEAVRGVKSERAIGTLMARGLIEEVGREQAPGRPYLYGTTRDFLDYFGISSAAQLPPLTISTDSSQEDDDA